MLLMPLIKCMTCFVKPGCSLGFFNFATGRGRVWFACSASSFLTRLRVSRSSCGVKFMSVRSSLIWEINPCYITTRALFANMLHLALKAGFRLLYLGRHFVTENLSLCFQRRIVS